MTKIDEKVVNELNKEKLSDLSRIAYDLYSRGLSLSFEQTQEYFTLIEDTWGKGEASGFLNLFIAKLQKYNDHSPKAVPFALTELIAENMNKEQKLKKE